MASFFPDESAYQRWTSSMPTVTMLPEEPDRRTDDPQEYGESDVELPLFYSPDLLLFRPNSRRAGVVEPYYAIYRVDDPQEADCCWPVRGQGIVYAAYVRDATRQPEGFVRGKTVVQARAAVAAYLEAHSMRRRQTRVFSSPE